MTDQHGKAGPVAAAMARAAREQPQPQPADGDEPDGREAPAADVAAGTYQPAATDEPTTSTASPQKRPVSTGRAGSAPGAGGQRSAGIRTGGTVQGRGLVAPTERSGGRPQQSFSVTKLLAGVVQSLALLALVLVFRAMIVGADPLQQIVWGVVAVMAQTMALTFFVMQRSEPMG